MPMMVALLALGRCLGTGSWCLGSFETSSEIYFIESLGVWKVLRLKILDYASSQLNLRESGNLTTTSHNLCNPQLDFTQDV